MSFTLTRRLWLPFFASIPIGTFLVLGLFTGPTSDDFCNADMLARLGYRVALKTYYLSWGGRYASTSMALLPGYLDHSVYLTWYWIFPTSLILVTLCSIHILLKTLNRFVLERALRGSEIAVASVVLTSVYLLGLERPNEVIYWYTASTGYQVANVLFILLLAALVRLYFADTTITKCFFLATSGTLVVLIVGNNEISMVLTLCVLGLSVLSLFVPAFENRTRSYAAMLICICGIGIIASLVALLAPGNNVRAQYEERYWGMHRADSLIELIQAGCGALIWAAVSSLRWLITQPSYCIAVFLALGVSRTFPTRVQEHLESRSLLWLPLIAFVLIWATAFPSFYLGNPPPARVTASIYIVFWLSVVASGVILMRHYRWQLQGNGVTTVLKIALVISLLLHPRHILATQEFKDAVLYRLQLQERDLIVSNAIHEGRRDIVVPRLMRVPTTIHVRDLSDDKHNYVNECYASYRNIDSVIARGDGDTSRIIRELKNKVSSQMSRLMPWR